MSCIDVPCPPVLPRAGTCRGPFEALQPAVNTSPIVAMSAIVQSASNRRRICVLSRHDWIDVAAFVSRDMLSFSSWRMASVVALGGAILQPAVFAYAHPLYNFSRPALPSTETATGTVVASGYDASRGSAGLCNRLRMEFGRQIPRPCELWHGKFR